MKGAEPVVRRSVLDRLVQSGEPEPRTAAESIRALKASVLRDIEWLLNTRRIAKHWRAPGHYAELQDSVYHYGLPELSADTAAGRRELIRDVTDAIQRFEPRLGSVRVSAAGDDESSRRVHLRVEAVLRLPDPEPIYFDTVLDPTSGRFNVPAAD